MTGSSRNSRWIAAAPEAVYRAFVEPDLQEWWLAPEGMTGRIHSFKGGVGGGYRISLYYAPSAPPVAGKFDEHEDRFYSRFVELVPHERIVQTITFDSEDPDVLGGMSMIVTFAPDGIRPEDNHAGTESSLAKLASLLKGGR